MSKLRRKEKRRKNNERYTVIDFFADILFWLPELIVLPFRLVFFIGRFLIRIIADL